MIVSNKTDEMRRKRKGWEAQPTSAPLIVTRGGSHANRLRLLFSGSLDGDDDFVWLTCYA